MSFARAIRVAAVAVLSTAMLASPTLANNGNGNGNGGGNGNGNGNGNGGSHSNAGGNGNGGGHTSQTSHKIQSVSTDVDTSVPDDNDAVPARKLGKLNGFLHASPSALAHAAPNSAVGKISKVYAGLLSSYLSPAPGTTPPTLEEVAAALSSASNKPLSPSVIEAVNNKLGSVNPTLDSSIDNYPGGSEALATAIDGAL